MKIAIVAPCAVPYVVGGAEKLWWGLASHLNEHTEHQVELVKVPVAEQELVPLIRGYEAFANLDLSGFDAVISGKYPAWMVSHPRHVCYMLHRLRGLYDCYPGAADVAPSLASHPGVAAFRNFMRRYHARTALPEFFGRWNELVASGARPEGLLDFPGPLSREMVHWLDDLALAPGAIVRYAAISATVAERPGYFPEGVEVGVAHPPPHRAMAPGERAEHFYTVSRLDHPKRVAMIVEAFRQVKTDLPLVIGGTGPEMDNLKRAAEGDARIRFAGYQSDAEVRECYRNALAVPFVPWQEDYGLIAVEAMQCAKPVVTTRDSGGPCELVEDGVSGFICDDNAKSLAEGLQRLADDRALAARMGRAALERGTQVTWDHVARTLLLERRPRTIARANGKRRKLVVTSTFPIFPPRHGGQHRSFHLYRAFAPEFETVIVSVGPANLPPFEGEIAPGVREIRIPMSPEHERREHEMTREVGTPLTDVVMPRLYELTPEIMRTLERESKDACAAVSSHPYLYPALAKLGLPIWYEAQDFELHIKTALFRNLPRGAELIEAVREVESACVTASELILCASRDDAKGLVEEFGIPADRILDVPNGTDALRIAYTPPEERRELKARMGIADAPIAFFMGSGHWPNIEAVKRIFEFAMAVPEVVFAVVGSVCYAFDPKLKPSNVLFVGEVDEITRNLCLQAVDVALNPMEHGSGTNLKMLDYFAAGLPVISTDRGARGLGLRDERECLLREIEDFPGALRELLGDGLEAAHERARVARALVEEEFDWDAIVRRIKPRLVAAADGVPALESTT